jgi:hypothetical protein
MNHKNLSMIAIGFAIGVVIASAFWYQDEQGMDAARAAAVESAMDAKKESRACQAKFETQTIILEAPAAEQQIGVNVLGGLARIVPGQALSAAMPVQPVPTWVIPAEITPKRIEAGRAPAYFYWATPDGKTQGPFPIGVQGASIGVGQ